MTPEWLPKGKESEAFDFIQERFKDIACYLESKGMTAVQCRIAMDYTGEDGTPKRYVWKDVHTDIIDMADEAE